MMRNYAKHLQWLEENKEKVSKRKNEIVSFLYYYFTSSFTGVRCQVVSTTTSPAEKAIVLSLSANKNESFDLLLALIPYSKTSVFDIILLTVDLVKGGIKMK